MYLRTYIKLSRQETPNSGERESKEEESGGVMECDSRGKGRGHVMSQMCYVERVEGQQERAQQSPNEPYPGQITQVRAHK